ncbi:MAG: hypothetical protein AB7F67_00295 [Rhodospirillaceae bacterium]
MASTAHTHGLTPGATRRTSSQQLALAVFAVALAGAAAAVLARYGHVNHDTVWLVMAAERLLDGGRYIDDVLELSPPVLLAAYMPGAVAGRVFGIDPYAAHLGWVALLIAGATLLCRPGLQRLFDRADGQPLPEAWLVPVVLAAMPGYDFGQKEHLFVILSLPALVLLAAERQRPGTPAGLVIAATVPAAVALTMKPYWLLVPAALVAWAALGPRVGRRFAAVALAAAAAAVAAIAVATLAGYAGWATIAGWATELHDAFGVAPARLARRTETAAIVLVFAAAATGAFLPRGTAARTLAGGLVVAAAAAFAAALLQRKGWAYHLLPVVQCATLAIGLVVLRLLRDRDVPRRLAGGLLVAVAMTTVVQHVYLAVNRAFRSDPAFVGEFAAHLRDHAAGRSFLAISTNQWPAFPAVVLAGARWVSRAPHQWMFPGAVRLLSGDAEQRARGAHYRDMALAMIADDIERHRPHAIAIDVGADQQGVGDGFDMPGFLRQDPRLRALLDGYREVARDDRWVFYVAGP